MKRILQHFIAAGPRWILPPQMAASPTRLTQLKTTRLTNTNSKHKSISDVTAAVAVTGGQFTYYNGGSLFTRTGAYDPVTVSEPGDTGLVSYACSDIGMSIVNGVNTDLTSTVGTPPADILSYQASTVNGSIFINVGFVQLKLRV